MVQNLVTLFSNETFHFEKFEDANVIMEIAFPIANLKNSHIRHFTPKLKVFAFLHELFHFGKFKVADFKYDNFFPHSYLKILKVFLTSEETSLL